MNKEIVILLLCATGIFFLGYVIGWIRGQKAMMLIIEDYKRAIASYRE